MTKDNILFGVVGLLAGLIIGFMFANSVNKGAIATIANTSTANSSTQSGGLPAGHPEVQGDKNGGQPGGAALPEVQAAIDQAKNNPNDFDAQIKAADLYEKIQNFDSAIGFLARANQIKPDDYQTIVRLGNDNYDSDKYEEAEKWYSQALAKKPDDVNVRTDMGLTFVLRSTPNYDRAIEEFKRSLEYQPNHTKTLQNLTVAYIKKDDAADASVTLAKLGSTDSSNPSIAKLRSDIEALKAK
ncbi:MAG TPA: tetratricopeptide repeat protein [Pyrinomonadaceae bacterium]